MADDERDIMVWGQHSRGYVVYVVKEHRKRALFALASRAVRHAALGRFLGLDASGAQNMNANSEGFKIDSVKLVVEITVLTKG